ncbi:ferredoxin:glutaredoxin reductase [bacterium]|nr:ferredoxin:glutaredoxin reductase [bacterium]MBU1434680.1 ferredoxin:glutaredoxin reductase [bacterium]MBU1502667.1 ferredoxin:glutaredoxin reductase [bacterium]
MTSFLNNSTEEIDNYIKKLKTSVKNTSYNLTLDEELLTDLCDGLLTGEKSLGYPFCPCRENTGDRKTDLHAICPCIYREQDLAEYGMCYCGLYVSDEFISSGKKPFPIPDRQFEPTVPTPEITIPQTALSVWRCSVCGYLCAMDTPPVKCPVCRASSDRFEKGAMSFIK